ncbi:MAG: hypothetical protein V1779_12155 [bacterium]
MTNRIILATICLVLAFATNGITAQEKGFTKQKMGNILYIDLPDYMTKTIGLNDIAKIQYQNTEKEAYLIMIEEDKEDIKLAGTEFTNAKDYYNFFIGNFGIDSIHVTSEEEVKTGKFPAYQAQVDGLVQGLNLFYLLTIVESPTHFYNIISWTKMDNKQQLINDFKKIASSLKE